MMRGHRTRCPNGILCETFCYIFFKFFNQYPLITEFKSVFLFLLDKQLLESLSERDTFLAVLVPSTYMHVN